MTSGLTLFIWRTMYHIATMVMMTVIANTMLLTIRPFLSELPRAEQEDEPAVGCIEYIAM